MSVDLEDATELRLDFLKLARVDEHQVLPCAVQDVTTNDVILIAYEELRDVTAQRRDSRAEAKPLSRHAATPAMTFLAEPGRFGDSVADSVLSTLRLTRSSPSRR